MKTRAYLDIETTGLSRDYCEITVIGVGLENSSNVKVIQLLEDSLTGYHLLKALKGVDEIYTYNGSRFDLPFIKASAGVDLKQEFVHTDLMYACWKQKLKGGLKAVERRIGIKRKLPWINGYMAVKLWWRYYNNNDRRALRTLLEYNTEDVVNLRTLRQELHVQ